MGPLATIVGKNDAGKSSILRALQLFFQDKPKLEASDVHDRASQDDDVVVEVAFTSLPEEIEFENGVQTTLQSEMLVDADGNLRIRKVYPRGDLKKCLISLITHDFNDERFAGLVALKEKELNDRCKSLGINVKKSGRGITNREKREALRARAKVDGVLNSKRELLLNPNDDIRKKILSILPEFELFESDTRLGVDETTFQSQSL